jgi:hypothetical protein
VVLGDGYAFKNIYMGYSTSIFVTPW